MDNSPDRPAAVLSYRRHESNEEMRWVVWWVGLYLILCGGQSVVYSVPLGQLSRASWRAFVMSPHSVTHLVGGLLFVAAGVGMVKRQRLAFLGSVALVCLSPFVRLVESWSAFRSLSAAMVGIAALDEMAIPTAWALALVSLLRRADQRGVLLPPKVAATAPPPGGDLLFLLQRVGWYWVSFAAMLLLALAWIPLDPAPQASEWKPYFYCLMISYFLRALCGLFLMRRRPAALLCLMALLVIDLPLSAWPAIRPGGNPFTPQQWTELLLHMGVALAPLVLLYRRLRPPTST